MLVEFSDMLNKSSKACIGSQRSLIGNDTAWLEQPKDDDESADNFYCKEEILGAEMLWVPNWLNGNG